MEKTKQALSPQQVREVDLKILRVPAGSYWLWNYTSGWPLVLQFGGFDKPYAAEGELEQPYEVGFESALVQYHFQTGLPPADYMPHDFFVYRCMPGHEFVAKVESGELVFLGTGSPIPWA